MGKQKSGKERGRFSSKRKADAVLRLLRGEALDELSRELGVTAATLSKDPEASPSPRGPGWWYWLWSRPWYEHQNLRDDRAEAFASILHGGVWEYSYLATATTPGTFVAPPPKAEEMYAPETFGRGAQDRVIVE